MYRDIWVIHGITEKGVNHTSFKLDQADIPDYLDIDKVKQFSKLQ